MTNKISFFLFLLLSLLNSSCVINKHYCVYYKTNLPELEKYPQISKKQYANFFIEDVYCCLESYSTNYYPNKLRKSAPFEIRLYCITSKDIYVKVVIDDIEITSNLNNNYSCEYKGQVVFGRDYIKCIDNKIYLRSSFPYGEKLNKFDFDYQSNEIIKIKLKLSLYDKQGNVYSKSPLYELHPITEIEYFDYLTDLF